MGRKDIPGTIAWLAAPATVPREIRVLRPSAALPPERSASLAHGAHLRRAIIRPAGRSTSATLRVAARSGKPDLAIGRAAVRCEASDARHIIASSVGGLGHRRGPDRRRGHEANLR